MCNQLLVDNNTSNHPNKLHVSSANFGTVSSVFINHLIYYPTPQNINYIWSFGSLAGIFFAVQIVTGIFLAMHYTSNTELAFFSVEHVMRDVSFG